MTMGRVLVFSFLALLVFWAVAFVAFVMRAVLLVAGVAPADPSSLFLPSNAIFMFAQILVLLILPALFLTFLIAGFAFRGRPSERDRWDPWMAWKTPRIVVALTAWNDEEPIRLAVKEFVRADHVIETIVVDNNSDDETAAVAGREGARVVIEPRRGYGNVCIRGLREALSVEKANIVVLAEGDMTFSASDMAKMIPYLEDVDMVVGTRTTFELTSKDSQMDWFMAWGNLFLALLIRLRYWDSRFLGKIRLTDVGCTFRAIRKESLARILGQLHVGDDVFSPHMIVAALRNHLRIIEVPIKFRKRVGTSKGASQSRRRAIRIGLQMLAEILA
jgi:hypothetical protein